MISHAWTTDCYRIIKNLQVAFEFCKKYYFFLFYVFIYIYLIFQNKFCIVDIFFDKEMKHKVYLHLVIVLKIFFHILRWFNFSFRLSINFGINTIIIGNFLQTKILYKISWILNRPLFTSVKMYIYVLRYIWIIIFPIVSNMSL